jgi:transcriptional regulator with XRE-family HTH domain
MTRSGRFGTAIERFARFGAPLELWQRAMGDEFGAVEPLLMPTNELATSWVPPNPDHPRMRVVHLGGGRYRAVCDEDISEPIDLTREALAHHRADERRIRKLLCETLGWSASRDDLRPLPGLLRIGEWRFSPSTGCPVWMACAATGPALAEHFREARVVADRPSIVLTPTRDAWSAEVERYAPSEVFLVATLDQAIAWRDGAWVEAAGWDEVLGGFMERAGLKPVGGFRQRRKKVKVAQAGGTAAKLKAEIRAWYRGARKHLLDFGALLPPPSRADLARACGVSEPTISRWLNSRYAKRDLELLQLWSGVTDEELVRNYRG